MPDFFFASWREGRDGGCRVIRAMFLSGSTEEVEVRLEFGDLLVLSIVIVIALGFWAKGLVIVRTSVVAAVIVSEAGLVGARRKTLVGA